MGQYEGIRLRSRGIISLLLFSVMLICSGCEKTVGDIRPDVNLSQGMVLYPDSVTGIQTLMEQDGTYIDNTAVDGIGSNKGGNTSEIVIVDPSSYAELPYSVVSAKDYSAYLDKYIYKPISSILDNLEHKGAAHLYFRVFHSGYETVAGSTVNISTGAVYDNKKIGSLTEVAGISIPTLAATWLGSLPVNSKVISHAKSNWINSLKDLDIKFNTTWASAASNNKIPKNLIMMWGNERLNAERFSDYMECVDSDIVGTVPSVSFFLHTDAKSRTTVSINSISSSMLLRYEDSMAKNSVDRLFGYYNQYPKRQASPISVIISDNYSMVFAYIDGYSKTIISLACERGYDLKDMLGQDYDYVQSMVCGAHDYTNWSEISKKVDNITVIQAGMRGVD